MIQWLKTLLSNNDDVSSNRIGFLELIQCVVFLCIMWVVIAIHGISWNLPVIDILNSMNVLIGIILGSGIITKNVGKYLETTKS